jgi:hypothetical protein
VGLVANLAPDWPRKLVGMKMPETKPSFNTENILFALWFALEETEYVGDLLAQGVAVEKFRRKFLETVERAGDEYSENYESDLRTKVEKQTELLENVVEIYQKDSANPREFSSTRQLAALREALFNYVGDNSLVHRAQSLVQKPLEISGDGPDKTAKRKLKSEIGIMDKRTLTKLKQLNERSWAPIGMDGLTKFLSVFFSEPAVAAAVKILDADKAKNPRDIELG